MVKKHLSRRKSSAKTRRKVLVRFGLPAVLVIVVAAIGIHFIHHSKAATAGVTVAGNQLYKDGEPFTPLGFTMVGLLTPPGCSNSTGQNAYAHLNQNEMDVAKNVWKANTLRFQISDNGLSGYTDALRAQYLQRIEEGVQLARSNGFVVILSLQDQGIGCGPARPLPTPESVAIWQTLANTFKDDPYIMFELWNEPYNAPTATVPASTATNYSYTLGWPDWLNGRTTTIKPAPNSATAWTPYVPVGHQTLVNTVRATGATNVVIADGANRGEHLEGVPLLTDSVIPEQIAYAAHTYYYTTSQTDWQTRWGYLTDTKPVVATEWDMSCGNSAEQSMAQQHLDWLKSKNIGLTAWGLDYINTLISDWNYTPTSPSNCKVNSGGQIVKSYFNSYNVSVDTPPSVSLSAPANQTVVNGSVAVTADASDDIGVSGVTFNYKVSSASSWTTIGSQQTTPPYGVTWNTAALKNGTYNLQALAVDTTGHKTASSQLTVTVSNPDVTAPTIAKPVVSSYTIKLGKTVTISVKASDNVKVTKVAFYVNGSLKATDKSSPYSISYKSPTKGRKTITAKAYDAAGNVTTSPSVTLTVK